MAVEIFHVVHGNLVFTNQARCDQALAAIQAFLARPAFKDAAEQTLFQYPAGKYGAGPSLVVTLRYVAGADADAVWEAAMTRWNFCIAGTKLQQVIVEQDNLGGPVAPAIVVHRRSNPVAPDDVA